MTRKSFLALLSGIAAWFAVKPKSLPLAAKVPFIPIVDSTAGYNDEIDRWPASKAPDWSTVYRRMIVKCGLPASPLKS